MILLYPPIVEYSTKSLLAGVAKNMHFNAVDAGLMIKHVSWDSDLVDLFELSRPILIRFLPLVGNRSVPAQLLLPQLLQQNPHSE